MNPPNEKSLYKGNILLGLQFISDFGDQVTAAILALCVLDITSSTSRVGLIYFISTVGFLLFTFFGGHLGDRVSKKNILVYSDLGRGVVALLMIFALKMKSMALIYIASFCLSTLGSLHRPVKFSLWSESLPRNYHERYNCLSELSTHASVIIGPLIASILLINKQENIGFCFNAITFLVCAAMISVFFTGYGVIVNKPQKSEPLIGFKLVCRDNELLKYVSYDAIQMLAHGAFNATFLVLAQRDFGWSKTQYSYHLTIAALFAVLGALLGTWNYVANQNASKKLIACTFISAIALALGLYFKFFPLCSLLFGICETVAIIAMIVTKTNVQMHAQEQYPNSISAILAARLIIIKSATLLGTGTCLLLEHFLKLEATLWIFLIPLALGFIPLAADMKKALNKQELESIS